LNRSTSFHLAAQNEPGDDHMPNKPRVLGCPHKGIRSCGIAKPPSHLSWIPGQHRYWRPVPERFFSVWVPFIRHFSIFISLQATSLFWCDFVFLLQPIFSACKQNLVRCRREYRIRCLPDRCLPDPPGRSYLQRVLTFSQCAGCRVSHAFTLRLVLRSGARWQGHACRIKIWLCHLQFKICARSDCVIAVYL